MKNSNVKAMHRKNRALECQYNTVIITFCDYWCFSCMLYTYIIIMEGGEGGGGGGGWEGGGREGGIERKEGGRKLT